MGGGLLTVMTHRTPQSSSKSPLSQMFSCLDIQYLLRPTELSSRESPRGEPPGASSLPAPPPVTPTPLTSSNFLALYWSAPLRKLSRMMSQRTVPWRRRGRAGSERWP